MLARLLAALMLLMLVHPASAFAYSYGDPNKEELAETYKEIAARLNQEPPDWNGAYQAYAARKEEIRLEFGGATVDTLEGNFARREKDQVLHNYKAVLVMNIDRRLSYTEQSFEDYAKAKLLLAKGRGTFNVLSPYVDAQTSQQVYAAFDKALTSLGNPGLFGVGKAESDKAEFQKQANAIRAALKPLYPLDPGKQPETPTGSPAQPGGGATPSEPATPGTPPSESAGSRVNPWVTAGTIAVLLAIAGSAIWFAKRKGRL